AVVGLKFDPPAIGLVSPASLDDRKDDVGLRTIVDDRQVDILFLGQALSDVFDRVLDVFSRIKESVSLRSRNEERKVQISLRVWSGCGRKAGIFGHQQRSGSWSGWTDSSRRRNWPWQRRWRCSPFGSRRGSDAENRRDDLLADACGLQLQKRVGGGVVLGLVRLRNGCEQNFLAHPCNCELDQLIVRAGAT